MPNVLTIARIAMIPAIILVFYIFPGNAPLLAALLFALAGVTDYLDGYLARIWDVRTRLGRFLDPIADKLLVASVIILLVYFDRADLLPAIAIVCREILVSGLREFLAEINVSVPVTKLAKYKTTMQMLAIFLLLLGPALPSDWAISEVGRILLWFAALLTLFTGYVYLKEGLRYMKDEEKHAKDPWLGAS